jgi:dinuclear metal center YbgI/SA1388 family protein
VNALIRVADVCQFLESLAPLHLAASWDNVGLLVGRPDRQVRKILTCLTISAVVIQEAIEAQVDLIVSHHPLPFRPTQTITPNDFTGKRLLDLLEAGIAVYSPHTAWDSAEQGINQTLAELLQLENVQPLIVEPGHRLGPPGSGRWGTLSRPSTVRDLADTLLDALRIDTCQVAGDPQRSVERVAVACGAGEDFLTLAAAAGCQLLVTGECRFHTAMEAEFLAVVILALGHYASERVGVVRLAQLIARQFPTLNVWASQQERDVWRWLTRRHEQESTR